MDEAGVGVDGGCVIEGETVELLSGMVIVHTYV